MRIAVFGAGYVGLVTGACFADLYYDGPKLHMVALRTPRASYWVINTLLDRMSNETMLAIAKGLQPFGKAKQGA